ncbi:hypothetical protein FGK63_07805 [Ruegeria sediminis]|uniref:Glycosyltransferase family 2 protein n=1 Tax=Ruegeria sediminis TaxID=2583820 RepID=A0ABY2X2T4_9RHOB|nr:glycosyltransferase family 2 protein [Ruegeria sediminis]TMV09016.1 hypothetical protein FGK63_07805 [Ruegeria sediminis]
MTLGSGQVRGPFFDVHHLRTYGHIRMNICAITMAWKDYWFLEKWVRYYSEQFGRNNLVIVSHGQDPRHEEIASGCQLLAVPRNGAMSEDLERQRWRFLSDISTMMLRHHDTVLCSDVDEIVLAADPTRRLQDVLTELGDFATISPVGVEILPPRQPYNQSAGIFPQCQAALFSSRYSKPCITRQPISWSVGGHGVFGNPWRVTPELILCHMQYANPEILEIRRSERAADSDATPDGAGLPAWSRKRRHRRGLIQLYNSLEATEKTTALNTAARLLQESQNTHPDGELRYPRRLGVLHAMQFDIGQLATEGL